MAGQGVGAPSGTLTFLFTDVEGSTRLWAADAEAMSVALRVHDAVLRETIASYSGHVFSTAGDSYAAAFSRASVAVECAAAIQDGLVAADWGAGPPLRVRVGLHLGEAEERDGDYFGPALNLAARVMSAAHGGQCVVTETVRDAARIKAIDLGHAPVAGHRGAGTCLSNRRRELPAVVEHGYWASCRCRFLARRLSAVSTRSTPYVVSLRSMRS